MPDEFSNGFWLGGELVTAESLAEKKAAPAPVEDTAVLRAEYEAKEAEWIKQRDGLLTDLADSLKREDALKANALPEDAEARLEAVQGISKALAQKALAALTAQAG